MLPEELFAVTPPTRGKRSDWLYDQALKIGALRVAWRYLGWDDAAALFEAETDHDKRAALVCLLTAGFAHAGSATVVGEPGGGWIWLPPATLWAEWARRGLEEAIARSRLRGFPQASTWAPPSH